MTPNARPILRTLLASVLATMLAAGPAAAVLDINDRGPVLDTGGFRLRVTNAGILGNAFFNVGLSNDPSFEFPSSSGHECLNHAELWVGGVDAFGYAHVSGGPTLEWRPTLDPEDHVRLARAGDLGSQRFVDDDGDGRADEEILNGKDDDGDGEIDEDIAMVGQAMASADYVDDRPEAINYLYPYGESHQPLGLSVHQEVYGWNMGGMKGLAGIRFKITNHSTSVVNGVYMGFLADLDSRTVSDRGGHLDDRIVTQSYSQVFNDGSASVDVTGINFGVPCVTQVSRTVPVLIDGVAGSGLPVVTVIGLSHTTDGLALLDAGRIYARAPGSVSFRYTLFSNSRGPGDGGVPTIDQQRYDAMAGKIADTNTDHPDDYQVLLSCGPFPYLLPGQTLTFDVAMIAADDLDSLRVEAQNALYLFHGYKMNLLPDTTGPTARHYDVGETGLNGHEACLEPPPGATFYEDPDCVGKFVSGFVELYPPKRHILYSHGHCVWTDADCDLCTGQHGVDDYEPWLDPGTLPPAPHFLVTPGDQEVKIEWDNLPEIVVGAHLAGTPRSKFVGYRLYRVGDWRNRISALPPLQNWALVHAYGSDSLNSELLLASVTDTTLDYDRILYEKKLYPVGRYHDVDKHVLNGFDYVYMVTAVMDFSYFNYAGIPQFRRVESPIVATFDQRVVPHAAAQASGSSVWVVPNPFRAHAGWDRPPTPGDPLTRHIDFMGLPKARATIKIFTVSGDLVETLQHDGTSGDGETPWDLISRNGQEVESGLYLFTVDSIFGHQIGHFVVIR